MTYLYSPLLWRHNGHDGVSNHQPRDCLLNRNSKKTSKLCVTGLCAGSSESPHKWPVTRKMFPFDDVIMLQNYIGLSNNRTIDLMTCRLSNIWHNTGILVIWIRANNFIWNLYQNTTVLIQENEFENIVCEIFGHFAPATMLNSLC